ncbi:hypothetical protein AA98_1498 [Escherichia coli 2-011-08_S1_C1]|nr:hypothetical protein AA98_1498 [Escherichia coli 2-011-08_S1_C1]
MPALRWLTVVLFGKHIFNQKDVKLITVVEVFHQINALIFNY